MKTKDQWMDKKNYKDLPGFFNKKNHCFFLSPEINPVLTLDYCKLNIIRVREVFAWFARASLSRIVFAADQYLAYSCNKQTEVNTA